MAEQDNDLLFNKAEMMNTAFQYVSENHGHFDCFYFHDVDSLSEDDRTMYVCQGK